MVLTFCSITLLWSIKKLLLFNQKNIFWQNICKVLELSSPALYLILDFCLTQRLELHVKSLSEARTEDKKHIEKLEKELLNCFQEIGSYSCRSR